MVHIGNSWDLVLDDVFKSNEYQTLRNFLINEYNSYKIFPQKTQIFSALKVTPFEKVSVVILGQDPYHGEGQADGMSFSVNPQIKTPPSLQNIFKEIENDIGVKNQNPCLKNWANQGVLLLNAVLTVRANQANSHKNCGWEFFTDNIIKKLNERKTPTVFMLWGANARAKKTLIHSPWHLVLETVHPSPLSAHSGFFGCGHFSKCNDFLERNGLEPIDWRT